MLVGVRLMPDRCHTIDARSGKCARGSSTTMRVAIGPCSAGRQWRRGGEPHWSYRQNRLSQLAQCCRSEVPANVAAAKACELRKRCVRFEDAAVTPDNDPVPPPFGALAPNAAQAVVIALAHHSGLKRGAFRPMLSRVVNLLRAGPVDVTYQGASFRLYHQLSATERGALFNPDYNREELDFLRAHTPGGGVFVDVGANVGVYALALARHVGPRGCVIAIEPHPMTHERLAFNRAASGFAQVTLVAAAAADADGELMIATDTDNLGASHVVTGLPAPDATKVPALRLQRILDE